MNRLTKTMTCGMLAVALGATSLAGCGKDSKIDGTKTVATCNGEEVSLGAASFLMRYTQAQMMSYYSMFGQSMSWTAYRMRRKVLPLGSLPRITLWTSWRI